MFMEIYLFIYLEATFELRTHSPLWQVLYVNYFVSISLLPNIKEKTKTNSF